MGSIVILIIGMLVVVGGILALRMHAFLALILAALIVAALTPTQSALQSELRATAGTISEVGEQTSIDGELFRRRVIITPPRGQRITDGQSFLLHADEEDDLHREAAATVRITSREGGKATAAIESTTPLANIVPGTRVIHESQYAAAESTADKHAAAVVATGFGGTAVSIGILIAMAAIIGMCLLESGAAERIVTSALRAVGERRAPIALSGSSFLLAIPVFFDTVFYLLIPLGKALRARTGRNYTLYIVAIVAGGTMAHSLVPPTPGPLLVAGLLDVDVGLMMIGGFLVGLVTVSAGIGYAYWINARLNVPLRDSDGAADWSSSAPPPLREGLGEGESRESIDDSESESDLQQSTISDRQSSISSNKAKDSPTTSALNPSSLDAPAITPSQPPPQGERAGASLTARRLPPLLLSLSPIVIPVLLIAGKTALDMAFRGEKELPGWYASIKPTVTVLGDKNIALIVGAAIGLLLLGRFGVRADRNAMRSKVQRALEAGGVIILITAAGGAFGHVLRQTDIAHTIEQLGATAEMGLLLLPMAFLITTLVRTAQGSATVSMITAGGVIAPIVAPMVAAGTLPYHPLYLALAIGCGSKPISWMNDSGFWVIGRMSGMTEAETLKTSSAVMIVMAVVGLAVTMLGAWVLPLV